MSISDAEHFVCVHGHFYQPPRENPWLEAVEVQDSAAPYHDWNHRVTAECYAPNAAARLLDEQSRIVALRNNYNRISFNFGPTLLAWIEQARPDLYGRIESADRDSARYFGRGSALAQAYGHCIMPLAGPRDQQTQVRWGIADFVHRFGRVPDGMWLPETAVDRTTLTVLAENGIRFTILAPSQAARVRYDGRRWEEVHDGRIDCQRPYRCALGRGLEITLFFYDADISHAVAFSGLLNDGRELARRLTAAALGRPAAPDAPPRLVHIATDGESYGHHHRFGEMALTAAVETIEREAQVRLTNYAAYLDRVAVIDDVEIRDNSSWSCAHGVERWRANCGCHSGGHPGWQQAWRAPLRQSLDWLKTQLDALFEQQGGKLLHDPWAVRDAYIAIVLRRDPERRDAFLQRHALPTPDSRARTRIWKLLEMERYALLSFTSCGWFFDEPSGLETTQVLSYAARAVQLAGHLGANLEPEFLRRLQLVRSNLPQYGDGRQLYRQLIRPQITDNNRVSAHYAMNSLFTPTEPKTRVYAYRVTSEDRVLERSGDTTFAIGRAHLRSEATEESCDFAYAALHLGGHDMHCAVAETTSGYAQLKAQLLETFFSEPLSELVRRIDHAFGGAFYALRHLFVAERRRILDHLMAQVMAEYSADYERIVSNNRRLLDFLAQARVPLPPELGLATGFVVQRRLEQAVATFVSGADGAEAALAVWADAQHWGIVPALGILQQLLEQALVRAVDAVARGDAHGGVTRAHAVLDLAESLALTLNLWEAQNHYYALVTTAGDEQWDAAAFAELRRLGERLSFRLREWDTLAIRAA
ncbi:MAG: DUF3536 domain-containing protein [Candidatus Binatia bacterium]